VRGASKTATKTYFEGYDPTIEEFLNSQKPLTARGYKTGLRLVFLYPNWLDNQPDRRISGTEMIANKRADKNYMWEKNTIQFKIWLKKQTTKRGGTYSDNSVDAAVMALRSLFDYYRTALNFSQSEGRKLNGRNKRKTVDYQLTNEVLKHMITVGDLREKGGSAYQTEIANEVFSGAKMKASRVLIKLESYTGYIMRARDKTGDYKVSLI
jgi:hypothetical protein